MSVWPSRSVALSVNDPRDEATLDIAPHPHGITGLAIRCGLAGTNGAVVWQPSSGVAAESNLIRSKDIAAVGATVCGAPINNVASLEAAARERRLYVEMQLQGVTVRGQLWPKIDLRDDEFTWLSDQQVVGVGPERRFDHYPMRFELDPEIPAFTIAHNVLRELRYTLLRYEPARSLGLYCGRAGVNGDLIAHLPDSKGVLTNRDILPVAPSGACGLAINNMASLLEALLAGKLYVAGTLADGSPWELRGQYFRTRGWEALATPAQVVGSLSADTVPALPVGLAISAPKDLGALYLNLDDLDRIDSLTLRCGVAGTDGPIVWQAADLPNWVSTFFGGADLVPTEPSGPCGVTINNVASLVAAAEERRLYVEIESDGRLLRGQLWPKLDPRPFIWMSDQQVPAASSAPPRWLRRPLTLSFAPPGDSPLHSAEHAPGALDAFTYSTTPSLPFTAFALKCGRAGEEGQTVAHLAPGLVETGTVKSSDLLATDAAGPCGMVVNNVASLLEALLRGHLYAEGVRADGVRVRGQYLPPAR